MVRLVRFWPDHYSRGKTILQKVNNKTKVLDLFSWLLHHSAWTRNLVFVIGNLEWYITHCMLLCFYVHMDFVLKALLQHISYWSFLLQKHEAVVNWVTTIGQMVINMTYNSKVTLTRMTTSARYPSVIMIPLR